MDLKKIFYNDKAVSPVIGVVLMVAITVILAAAIGSSVFGQSPAKSAPQSNINAQFSNYNASNFPQNITIEHLGGDSISWSTAEIHLYNANGTEVNLDTDVFSTDTPFEVGDVKSININDTTTYIQKNSLYNVKIVDSVSNQLICDKELRT